VPYDLAIRSGQLKQGVNGMRTSIKVENGHYHWINADKRQIWRINFNPKNGMYFILNTKTDMQWELLECQMVYGNGHTHSQIEMFPNYVHEAVHTISEYAFKMRLQQ
jgi:hypothetical protein